MTWHKAVKMPSSQMLQRPIFGGVFGMGRYALATRPCVANGLHSVQFMVIDPQMGAVLSFADNKLEALASARRALRLAGSADEAANDERWQQRLLWPDDALPVAHQLGPRLVSRRRRQIFEKSEGRCHYCTSPLTLDGKWHVEHMVPRALNGGDDPLNLVAACVACNLAKRDRTAVEFVIHRDR